MGPGQPGDARPPSCARSTAELVGRILDCAPSRGAPAEGADRPLAQHRPADRGRVRGQRLRASRSRPASPARRWTPISASASPASLRDPPRHVRLLGHPRHRLARQPARPARAAGRRHPAGAPRGGAAGERGGGGGRPRALGGAARRALLEPQPGPEPRGAAAPRARHRGPGVAARLAPAAFAAALAGYTEPVLAYPPSSARTRPARCASWPRAGVALGIVSNTGRTPGVVLRRVLERYGLLGVLRRGLLFRRGRRPEAGGRDLPRDPRAGRGGGRRRRFTSATTRTPTWSGRRASGCARRTTPRASAAPPPRRT